MTDREHAGKLGGPVEVLVVGGAALVMAVIFGGWTWGQTAGLIFRFSWPDVELGAMPSVVGGLGSHWDDPRRAWPIAAQAELPGPLGFYVAAALLLVFLAALMYLCVRSIRWQRGRRSSRRATAGPRSGQQPTFDIRHRPDRPDGESAAWATEAQLRGVGLNVEGTPAGRLGIGWAYGSLLATRREHSLLAVGAPRSGKTAGLAIPALLEWQGSAIVLSAKTDLVHETHGSRGERGDVLVFDPTGVTGLPSAGWSPLSRSRTWRGAVRSANALSRLSGTTAGLGGSAHWERIAAQVLAPLLRAAAADEAFDIGDVVRWVQDQRIDEAKAMLGALAEKDPDVAVGTRSLDQYARMDPRMRDSAFGTASTVLDCYQDTDVVASARSWDITPERLADDSITTVFLVANPSDQERLAPVFLALLDELMSAAQARASTRRAQTGKPVEDDRQRLLLLLDEAANVAPLPNLASLASTGGSEGIQLVTVLQDLAQLRHRYPHEWGSIFSNHVAKVILPGVTDPETLRTFSQAIGREEIISRSTSRSRGQRSVAESVRTREIISERGLRELPTGSGACVYGDLPPIRFGLRSYFDDRALSEMARQTTAVPTDLDRSAAASSVTSPGPTRLAIPADKLEVYLASGDAERVGSASTSPVKLAERFYALDASGTRYLPVTDSAQVQALQEGLHRMRER